jgi:hypothetical protein
MKTYGNVFNAAKVNKKITLATKVLKKLQICMSYYSLLQVFGYTRLKFRAPGLQKVI